MHKVLLVDDQKLIRDGITSLLALSGKVEVVGECADGSGVVSACIALQPHVVLLDLSMPVMNGVQTLAALKQAGITIPVLILTTFDEHELEIAGEFFLEGAAGLLVHRRVVADSRVWAATGFYTHESIRRECIGTQ